MKFKTGLFLVVVMVFVLVFIGKPSKPLPAGVKADLIEVYKRKRTLNLMQNGTLLKAYKIALGNQPNGHKQFEGDEKTPEGPYVIDWRNDKSCCHLSLHISYPNVNDKAYANQNGLSAGGNIMIHGIRPKYKHFAFMHRWFPTDGCIRVNNKEMDEIWSAVDNGTPIKIYP